jgi:exonuclease V
MASPARDESIVELLNDDDTDYGSDFSPEEEQIVQRLLSGQVEDDNDNSIILQIDQDGPQQNLRLPRVFGREQRSPLFQATRAAERVAEQISDFIESGEHYPDCKTLVFVPLE